MNGAYAHSHGPDFGPAMRRKARRYHAMTRHGHGDWGRGFGGPGDFGGRGGRRRRMRRGDVRAAILVLLAEQPFNGYGLMQ